MARWRGQSSGTSALSCSCCTFYPLLLPACILYINGAKSAVFLPACMPQLLLLMREHIIETHYVDDEIFAKPGSRW